VRDDFARLQDIVEAADAVEKYSVRGREAFEQDELIHWRGGSWALPGLS